MAYQNSESSGNWRGRGIGRGYNQSRGSNWHRDDSSNSRGRGSNNSWNEVRSIKTDINSKQNDGWSNSTNRIEDDRSYTQNRQQKWSDQESKEQTDWSNSQNRQTKWSEQSNDGHNDSWSVSNNRRSNFRRAGTNDRGRGYRNPTNERSNEWMDDSANGGGHKNEENRGSQKNDGWHGSQNNYERKGGRSNDSWGGSRNNDRMSDCSNNDSWSGGRNNDSWSGGRNNDRSDCRNNDRWSGGRNNDRRSDSSNNDRWTGGRNNDKWSGGRRNDEWGQNQTNVETHKVVEAEEDWGDSTENVFNTSKEHQKILDEQFTNKSSKPIKKDYNLPDDMSQIKISTSEWPEEDQTAAKEQREKELKLAIWMEGYRKKREKRKKAEEQENLKYSSANMDWDDHHKLQQLRKQRMTEKYPPIVKNTYIEDSAVANMTPRQVKDLRFSLNEMTITNLKGEPVNILNPVRTFEEAFEPYPQFLNLIKKHGFEKPSPVQSQLWPLIMSGYDVVGIAQTGTGKTLAYLLPGLVHIEKSEYFHSKKRDGPVALVLAPTRELAQQIHAEISKFSVRHIKTVCVYGQGNRNQQLMDLDGCDIIVATPGRLIDFVTSSDVILEGVSYFVLDEADRMLDMGFHADIMKIYYRMRIDRQVILTSATWQSYLNFTTKNMMKDAIKVNIGKLDLAAVETVTQKIIVCEDNEKDKIFYELLHNLEEDDKVIVFVNRKTGADYLSVQCNTDENIYVEVMHGGMVQADREMALQNLKDGATKILIATDVASRGLDVQDLTKVINLDMPKNMEEYVHRSGRTGRAGKSGEVITFVTWDDKRNVPELIKIMERSSQEIPPELQKMSQRAERWLENNKDRDGGRGRGRGRGRGGGRGGFGY